MTSNSTARDVIVDALTTRHEELSGEASPRDFDGARQILRALKDAGYQIVPDEKWWITDDHGNKICGPFHSRDAALEARVPLERYLHPATFPVMDAEEMPSRSGR